METITMIRLGMVLTFLCGAVIGYCIKIGIERIKASTEQYIENEVELRMRIKENEKKLKKARK